MAENEKKRNHFVDAGRAESDIYEGDPDVAEVFESEKHGHGARSGGEKMRKQIKEHHGLDHNLNAGDPDTDIEDVAFVGEEAVGGGNPTPDHDIVDEIGEAVGLEYQANEPLHTEEKLENRDRRRWELDPASSEDYRDRNRRGKD